MAYGQGDQFQTFLQLIYQAPLLTAEEETQLALRYREAGDITAAHTLVTSHMRLVVKTAREYKGYGLPMADVIQEGILGLMQAVKRYHPERGARLATYALWWIRAAIHEFILNTWSMVKIGTTQLKRRLFFKLRQNKSNLSPLSLEEANELAEKLGADTQTILEMDGRMSGKDDSLNRQMLDQGGEILNLIPDHRPNQEMRYLALEKNRLLVRLVAQGLQKLDPRERYIIENRLMTDAPKTLETLGEEMSVTRERIRQLEKRALEKLRTFFQSTPEGREMIPASILSGQV
ncbi:MAG: sigma-70 family RNA polymerase sigma factor [Magnetococcales bacterium]|nr:RNA polymerase factor sigma-32 [Magnetococcales bacterium]NGZ26412.1 sigma-70 family RNA polymerase sigma factor [Magnetococcales bacterium]